MRIAILTLATTATLAAAAPAADLVVAENGAGGAFPTIGHAMAVAAPGDRILVHPGSYPSFQFAVAVDLVGLGTAPGQVRIDSIDYHVSIPTVGYDTLLSNVTVGGFGGAGSIAISGNELPPGTLHLDAVVVEGAIFLRGGATGFHLLVSNSYVAPAPGQGFSGEAVYCGGPNNLVEIRDSTILGAAGSGGAAPLAGIRLFAGTAARIVDTTVSGGDALLATPGASAIVQGGPPGTVELRLDGGSVISGGDGLGGPGGAGVDVTGTIQVGQALVAGGAGFPAGNAYAGATPTPLPLPLHLDVVPALHDAITPYLASGSSLTLQMQTPAQASAIVLGFDLDVPPPGLFLPFDFAGSVWIPGNQVNLTIPAVPGVPYAGLEVYAQGLTLHGGEILLSETAAVRIDLQ